MIEKTDKRRPVGVVLIVIWQLVQGLYSVYMGILIIKAQAIPVAAFSLFFGFLSFLVMYGLWKLKNWARILAIVLVYIDLLISFLGVAHGELWQIGGIVICVAILSYLMKSKTKEVFGIKINENTKNQSTIEKTTVQDKTNQKANIYISVALLIFAVFGVLIFLTDCFYILTCNERVTGVIRKNGLSESRPKSRLLPKIGYLYLGGDVYRYSTRIYPTNWMRWSPKTAHSLMRKHRYDTKVTIYYNSENPRRCILYPEININNLFITFVCIVFAWIMKKR
jgi:Ca2+/Na+ antiporter